MKIFGMKKQKREADLEKKFVYDSSVLDEDKVSAIVHLRGVLNVPELKNLSDEEMKRFIIEEKYAAYEKLNRH